MREITPKTRVCAIFGHPVGHSLSPALHNAAFEALGLPFVYVAHDVASQQLADAMRGVRAMGYRGLSITVPHKIAALQLVDDADEIARGIGCINTVVVEDSRMTGYNSDGRGALSALRTSSADPQGRKVVILGSGGAARALAITLTMEATPREIVIISPVADERVRLVEDTRRLGGCPVRGSELDSSALQHELATAELLLQCTPVGMHPNVDSSLVDPRHLHSRLTVFDAVYNPRETKLLRDAKAAGCTVVPGLEMFLGQAIVQFELWTGAKAPVELMRRTLEQRL